MVDASFLPNDLQEELEATVTSVFSRAVAACDASSSLERTARVRDAVIDSVHTILAKALAVPNAQLSLQDRLPPELWLAVWKDLSMGERFAVSHVCSRWRQLATQCPDLRTRIDCYSELNTVNPGGHVQHFADDHVRHSTDGFVAIALERAKERKLFLSFSIVPGCECEDGSVERLAAMLAPHARNVAAIHLITCPVHSALTILSRLHPLLSLQVLEYTSIALTAYHSTPITLPILPRALLPHLETLHLPHTGSYLWPYATPDQPPSDGQPFLSDSDPPFPALRELHYAPSDTQDVLRALRDCPHLSTLGVDLNGFEYDDSHAEALQHAASRLRSLDLREMPVALAQLILPTFAAPDRSRFAVVARALPRTVLQPDWINWYYPPVEIPDDIARGSKLRNGATTIYRRLANATKTFLRAKGRSETAEGESPAAPPPSWWEAPARYDGNGLRWLTSHFSDLGTRISLVLYLRQHWASPHATITLRAADNQGHVRLAALQPCDLDAVPELLSHTCQTYMPIYCVDSITAETWLLPLLLSSLPDVMPTAVLQLLFNPDAAAQNRAIAGLEPVEGTSFPNLRTLCFGPRDVTSAEPVVVAAQDVAVFVNSLGAELPLRSIIIGRGVVVEDASVLDCLALSVVLQADPINLL